MFVFIKQCHVDVSVVSSDNREKDPVTADVNRCFSRAFAGEE